MIVCATAGFSRNREIRKKNTKVPFTTFEHRVIVRIVRSHPGFATPEFMVEFWLCWAGRLTLQSFLRVLHLLTPQDRDGKGSTASRREALTGVVTVAIRVVRPPRDKSRSVPVWPVGSSGTFGPRGGHHTSSPDEDVAKSRIGSRLSPSVSGGNDAHDTRVDRAANRGHRPRVLRLCQIRREG
jgi:hypothetical protein